MFGSHWHLLFKLETVVVVDIGLIVENENEVVVEKSVMVIGNVSVGKNVVAWFLTIPDIRPFEQILLSDVIFFKLHNWK